MRKNLVLQWQKQPSVINTRGALQIRIRFVRQRSDPTLELTNKQTGLLENEWKICQGNRMKVYKL